MQRHEIVAIVNRFVALACSAALLVLHLRYLGNVGLGKIGLVNIGILIYASISQFVGGSGLIYLIPRNRESNYLKASVIWILFSGAITLFSQVMLQAREITAILGLGALQSFFMLCQMLLLSRNKIMKYQALLFIQALSSLIFVILFYATARKARLDDFILAQFLSFTITALAGLAFTWPQWKNWLQPIPYDTVKEAGQLGIYTQTGNILHMLNNRSYLYFLEKFSLYSVGIFATATYISEAILTVSKGLSAVQVSKIAQSDDHKEHKKITLKYLWIGLGTSLVGIISFLLLPANLIYYIFGPDSLYLKGTFLLLTPGVMAASCISTLAHYFSGKGLNKYNAISSAVGFVTAIISAAILVPDQRFFGAAKAMSITFTVQAIAQIILFRKALKEVSQDQTGR